MVATCCTLQKLPIKKNTLAVALPLSYPMMLPSAMHKKSVWQYCSFGEPAQVLKYGNLKCSESLSFLDDIESLESYEFNPADC